MPMFGNTIPPNLSGRRIPVWAMNLLLTLLLIGAWFLSPFIGDNLDPYYFDLLMRIGIAIILAVSLNLINGITGQFSLGHAGFMAVGAYVCGMFVKHLSVTGRLPAGLGADGVLLGTTILGGLVAALAGLLIGIPALRLRGDYLAIATLGFGEIIGVIINANDSVAGIEMGGAAGLHDIPHLTHFFWVFFWCQICVVSVWRIVHSAKGRAFLAVREDEIAAAAMGINTTYHKAAAFVIGAFFAGAAGALSATFVGNLAPTSFNFMRSVEIVVMVILGGSGSITGAMAAAAVLTYLPEQLRFLSQWRMVIYALVLILLMLLRPEGLLGNRELWLTRRRITRSQPMKEP